MKFSFRSFSDKALRNRRILSVFLACPQMFLALVVKKSPKVLFSYAHLTISKEKI